MIITQEELKALITYYQNDMAKQGIKFGTNNIIIKLNNSCSNCATTYYIKTYGTVKLRIEFSRIYLDGCTLNQLRNTIVHELCHCINDTINDGHGLIWKKYAKQCSNRYGLNITTFADETETEIFAKKAKYHIVCDNCGIVGHKYKSCKVTKFPYLYHCSICGGKLHIKQNDEV